MHQHDDMPQSNMSNSQFVIRHIITLMILILITGTLIVDLQNAFLISFLARLQEVLIALVVLFPITLGV